MEKTVKLITKTADKENFDNVDKYILNGGFKGLKKAVSMQREDIIQELIDSKLLGRGGAGYPTGLKWKSLYSIEESPKYIVCNGDEGEPGTFKDRFFIERNPLRIIEGMLVAAYVFNSKDGYIYIRGEYRHLIEGFNKVVENTEKAGYLGKNILGIDGFDFNIHIISGAGAYICGESSSMLNSIEAKTGMPRIKPPHLAEVGLFQMPTLVNNIETFAAIPIILEEGAKYFKSIGTEDDGGSIMICLSGHAKNKGVYEIPLGTCLKDIIYDEELGGGTESGKKINFVHLGGQSGPLAFPEQFEVSYDYKSLKAIGLTKGTGAVVVCDETVDLIDYLKKVFEFFNEESCGKCNPCREGNQQMYLILDRISKGNGKMKDIQTMKDLAFAMSQASFCGLGQASCTALMSALNHRLDVFKSKMMDDEYAMERGF